MKSVWRNRDFRLVWAAQGLSDLGNGVTQLAYPLLMLALTGSPLAAGALAAARAVPYVVLGLPAGALVDRWNRRRVMIVCDLVRAANLATVPAALLLGTLTPAHLVVTGVVGGVCHVFFSAAEGACLPNVVRPEQLTTAVSAQETTQAVTVLVAGPVGGVLLQVSRGLPFLADALSFLASALCLAYVRAPFHTADPRGPRQRLRREIADGVSWLWRHPVLRTVVGMAAGLQVAISGIALVAIVIARDSGASPAVIGTLFSALGVGGVVGALLAPWLRRRVGLVRLLLAVLWTQAGLWVVLAFTDTLVVVAATLGGFAVTMPCFGIAALSYQLEVTPDHLRGRVGTTFQLMIWAATPVGAAVAGLLLDTLAARTAALVFAAWVALFSALSTARLSTARLSTARPRDNQQTVDA